MNKGRISYAVHNGSFVLKCVGDVRLTYCAALNDVIERKLEAGCFQSIIIDLTEAVSVDSTTLGLLVKLSMLSRDNIGMLPTLASTGSDINQQLEAMGLAQVFNIVHSQIPCPDCLIDLPEQSRSEEEVRERVLEAHRILMALNESNHAAFRDLVLLLEGADTSC